MKSREFIGLALIEHVLAAPGKMRPPNNPLNLLTLEFNHDECSAQPSPADAQPDRRGGRVLRRSAERG